MAGKANLAQQGRAKEGGHGESAAVAKSSSSLSSSCRAKGEGEGRELTVARRRQRFEVRDPERQVEVGGRPVGVVTIGWREPRMDCKSELQ